MFFEENHRQKPLKSAWRIHYLATNYFLSWNRTFKLMHLSSEKREKENKMNRIIIKIFFSIDKKILRVLCVLEILDKFFFFSPCRLAKFDLRNRDFSLCARSNWCRTSFHSFRIGYLVLIRRTSIFTQQVLSMMMKNNKKKEKDNEKIRERERREFSSDVFYVMKCGKNFVWCSRSCISTMTISKM